jgi:hypothetical protein
MRAVKKHFGDACPKCKESGKHSPVIWELHPWDTQAITMEDQVHGFCDKCGGIIVEADLIFRLV